ncbi:MAG: hypothetical protein KDC98_08910 [Planctomycetes bacterium]|nr:hypothetical protein [Planctomycetota bacterium]
MSIVAVAAAVATIASVQHQHGRWPIADAVRIAQYGTTTQAIVRLALMLGVFIGTPCLIAAALVAVPKRPQRSHPPHPSSR